MFFKEDNIDKCTIFNKFLVDDLKPYRLYKPVGQESSPDIYIEYKPDSINTSIFLESKPNIRVSDPNKRIDINLEALESFINSSVSADKKLIKDTWFPVFVDNSTYIVNKPIFGGVSIDNTRLGIENFIKFPAFFQNWTNNGNRVTMSIDWILNSITAPLDATYGLLCWVKYPSPSAAQDITKFPKNSRLVGSNNKEYIKIDDSQVFEINTDSSEFTSNSIIFNDTNSIKSISSLSTPSPITFTLKTEIIDYWIPEGDFFAFFNDEEDKDSCYSQNISSRSYLSPTLYNKYTQIYHILTLDEIKKLDGGRHLRKSRLLKRLCYLLATSPFLNDGTTHNFLYTDHIKALVNNYLNQNIASTETEIDSIKNIIYLISKYFTDTKLINKLNQKNLGGNYISNNMDLFSKLLHKYGASVLIENSLTLSYKNLLTHGDNIFINQVTSSLYEKNTTASILYNNQKIELGEIIIDTKMDTQFSEIILSGKNTEKPKILPCLDIAKPIPEPTSDSLRFSIGRDQIEKYPTGQNSGELSFEIKTIKDISLGDISLDSYISYTWELLEGPCLRFGDFSRDKYRVQRFMTSNDSNPKIYVYKPGLYRIKCSVSTDFGTVSDTKTIYVVDDENKYDGINSPPEISSSPPLKSLRTSPVRIMCPNLNQVLINKRGLFWPLKTDLYIGKMSGFGQGYVKLQGLNKFAFDIDSKHVKNNNSPLKLTYNANNTTIKLRRIILKNIRSEHPACAQCMSSYQDLLTASKPTYARAFRPPDEIVLSRYKSESRLEDITFSYPQISTDFAPKIKSYGGYSGNILSGIPILGLNGVDVNTILPVITGHKLDYKNKICFEKESSDHDKDIIIGNKGVFYPSSGFFLEENIPNETWKNKTWVLKFNPGARSCFNFIGGGFNKLTSSHDNEGNNKANIFKSSITLNIDSKIIPDPPPKNFSKNEAEKQKEIVAWLNGNQRKEIPDHDVNHGYRSLNEGFNINSDEFGYGASFLQKTDPSCDGSSVTYTFKSLGPKRIHTAEMAALDETVSLQDVVVPGMSIGNIEVKLNFLNYINTKNLIVWLDVDVSAQEIGKLFRVTSNGKPNYACQINGDGISPDDQWSAYCNSPETIKDSIANTGLAQYMIDLVNMNYVPVTTENYTYEEPPEGQEAPTVPDALSNRAKMRLYLLNKEHIHNNTYNFSIKFSDNHSKPNTLSNINITSGNIPYAQNIIQNNMTLSPTTMASGYNDIQYMEYLSIIKNNPIPFTNNSFSKFRGLSLFNGAETSNSSTTFTLNIAVLDENDDMTLYDNIIGSDMLTGYSTSINKEQSTNIVNSLCSWELIFNTADGRFDTTISSDKHHNQDKKDFLGLINYNTIVRDMAYPGYNYILDLKDKFHLLPKANHNAPFNFLNNTTLCKYPSFELSENPLYKTVRFPSEIFIQIMVTAYATTILGLGGGLGGLLAGLGIGQDLGYKGITDYYKSKRDTDNINDFNTFIDRANYDKYSFGSSEKILLNASKDGNIWYKLEASIFKYQNTPPLKANKYSYINCKNVDAGSVMGIRGPLFSCVRIKLEEFWDKEYIKSLKAAGPTFKNDDIIEGENNELFLYRENQSHIKFPEALFYHPKLSQQYIYPSKFDASTLENKPESSLFNDTTHTRFMIEGRTLYDILCISATRDVVLFNSTNESTNGLRRLSITGTPYLIYKDNKYYTILTFDSLDLLPGFDPNGIALVKGMILFKNNDVKSTVLLSKEQFSNNTPIDTFSLMGAGSYGQGSPFIRPDILTNNQIDNTLENISKISQKVTLILDNFTKVRDTPIYTIPIDTNGKNLLYNNIIMLQDTKDEELIQSLQKSIIEVSENRYMLYAPYAELADAELADAGPLGDYGYVSVLEDLAINTPMQYLTQSDIDKIITRIQYLEGDGYDQVINKVGDISETELIINNGSIKNLQDHYSTITSNDPAICFDKNNTDNSTCYRKLTQQAIYDRYTERNDLIKALEDSAIANTGVPGAYLAKVNNAIPYLQLELKSNTSNPSVLEVSRQTVNSHKYWINIDPKQVCSRAYDVGPKILKSIKYTCRDNAGGIPDLDSPNICPHGENIPNTETFTNEAQGSKNPARIHRNADMMFTKSGNTFTYTTPSRTITREKTLYPNIRSWMEYPVSREFLINSGGLTDIKVDSYEIYLVPVDDTVPVDDYSAIPNRVCSIFNLDTANQIQLKIRNMPRKLKGIDNHYDKYFAGPTGALSKSTLPSDGGPVWANPRFWHCLQVDPNDHENPENFRFTSVTDYLKLQNEMIFRAFYNSIDGIEHKSEFLESLYPWEWIPYEYFTKPEPEPE